MTPETVLTVGRKALELTVMMGAPLLLCALVIGVFIGIIQAATQINEMTLSFVPKLVGMVLVLLVSGPWLVHILVDFTRLLYNSIPALIG